jgi:triacylglycerol lipase
MTSTITSLPMYFPGAPFSLPDSVTCAGLVEVAYDQCAQWVAQQYPSHQNFTWKPKATRVPYTYSAPLFWTNTWFGVSYDEPFGFVVQAANGDTFLILRGTVTDADDYQDARLDQSPFTLASNYGNVHAGFYTIYQSLSPQVHDALKALSTISRLLFAGHSLGSGLSSLAVADVVTNASLGNSVQMLHYNLASPRVGDPTFATAMNSGPVPTFRIVNTEDIVPDAPPSVVGSILYQHIGTPVDFTAQYGTLGDNHSLLISYTYALNNPTAPQGPLPTRTLMIVGPLPQSSRRVAVRLTAV